MRRGRPTSPTGAIAITVWSMRWSVGRTTPSRAVRAKVEHPIGVIKRVFGFAKVRYRGLAKYTHRLWVTCALVNLFTVRRRDGSGRWHGQAAGQPGSQKYGALPFGHAIRLAQPAGLPAPGLTTPEAARKEANSEGP
jgi:hypothetical protein